MLKPSVDAAEYTSFYRLNSTKLEFIFGIGRDEGKDYYLDLKGRKQISENERSIL